MLKSVSFSDDDINQVNFYINNDNDYLEIDVNGETTVTLSKEDVNVLQNILFGLEGIYSNESK